MMASGAGWVDGDLVRVESREIVVVTGVRATQGGAVQCPQIRDDAGTLWSVSHLSAEVALGDRVTVSGHYGVSTSCVGTVLIVEQEQIHPASKQRPEDQ